MELRHIRYFLAIAEELNFSRAAEKLHIAQPPLSRQIRELEEELGVKLLHRTNRQVELTNAGKVFQKKAAELIEQVEQTVVSTRLSATGQVGELQIGFNGAVQDLTPTLKAFQAFYPNVGIILKQMTSLEQIDALNRKQIDFATITIPVKNENIQTFQIATLPFQVALYENHPLLAKEKIFIADLEHEPFIITNKSSGPLFFEAFMRVFQHAHYIPKIAIQTNDLQTIIALVASGMGITVTPSPITSTAGVILRKLEDVDVSIPATLAWREDNFSEVVDNFLRFFKEFHEMKG